MYYSKGTIFKRVIIITLILLVLAGAAFLAFNHFKKQAEYEEKYEELLQAITPSSSGYFNFKNINDLLDALPEDYKDVNRIEKEAAFIEEYYKNAFGYFATDYFSIHTAAMTLLREAENYPDWHLQELVYNRGKLSKETMLGILLAKWEDANGNSIKIYEGESGIILHNNLPNDKKSSEKYYYYVNGDTFGYSLQSDSNSKFKAFRVISITATTLTVYNYKDATYYYLTNRTDPITSSSNSNYILNTSTKVFHLPSCNYLPTLSNRKVIPKADIDYYSNYDPCSHCKPISYSYKDTNSENSDFDSGAFIISLILNLIVTAFAFLLAPLIKLKVSGKISKKSAALFAVVNSILVETIFTIISFMLGEPDYNFTPAVLYGFLSYFLLRHKYL